jgi:aldehyde:ferredoxin oxidoreductase
LNKGILYTIKHLESSAEVRLRQADVNLPLFLLPNGPNQKENQAMKFYGWVGKYLDVDLTHRTVTVETLDPEFARNNVGGLGFGLSILSEEIAPGGDAFEPSSPIVFATSPVTATDVPTSGGYIVINQSPLSQSISRSEANGFFGLRLKSAGFDYIVIRGKADQPVYLWVHDDQAEIKDASAVWGKGSHETEAMLKAEVGERNASVASIGQAGENMVRYASINSDFGHSATRGGPGAVMGSKNLKAVVAFGKREMEVHDPVRTKLLVDEWVKTVKSYETIKSGAAEDLSLDRQTVTKPCYKCPINHCRWIYLADQRYGLSRVDKPEPDTLEGFTEYLGITDLDQMLWLHDQADDYGMDVKSLFMAINLMMQAYDNELINLDQLGGVNLKYGDAEATSKLMRQIAYREGFSQVLGEDLRTITQTIGGEAASLVKDVKGMGIPLKESRAAAVKEESWRPSPEVMAQLQSLKVLMDVFVICGLPGPLTSVPPGLMVETLSAITGVDYTLDEFNQILAEIQLKTGSPNSKGVQSPREPSKEHSDGKSCC